MNDLRAAIVDDEPLARARLRRLLKKAGGGAVEIVAECVDVGELMAAAKGCVMDVVFLDIEMPGKSGFDALADWRGPRPQIVFVTAYDQYGARAFDERATDYLTKPVTLERLRDALGRVHLMAQAKPVMATSSTGRRLPLLIGQRTYLVPVADIDLVTAHGNYLEIATSDSTYTTRCTLSRLYAQLEGEGFVRLHKSFFVRIAAVRSVKPLGSGRFCITLRGGNSVNSGRLFHEQVRMILQGQYI